MQKSRWQRVSEQFISSFSWISISGIRSTFRIVGNRFWPRSHPLSEGTIVNYEYTRKLYRNAGENQLGAGFAKPIIDIQVGFMGIPTVETDAETDDALDDFLNDCLRIHWTEEIQQMIRDSMRDSKVIVRLRKPDILDPLMTMDEAQHLCLECLPPERVDIQRNHLNRNIIDRAIVIHRMIFVINEGDVELGLEPIQEEHDVLEIITRDSIRFFDQYTSQYLPELESTNADGLVPFLEVMNEWDAALQGGQSELESVIPFINAFHDVITQGLQAHKYHSTPKIKMKLADIAPFIKNNFPDAWDQETGTVKPGAEVSWQGREIIFLDTDDEMEFLEATSVLGDTKTIAEFLIDCICIASQTPEWAFMRVDSGSANSDRNAQTVPLMQKIDRKRRNYEKPIQTLCKMALVMMGEIPHKPKIIWEIVRPDDNLIMAQAFQQMLMGLEVAAQTGQISDDTYRETIRQFLPYMEGSQKEAPQAQKDMVRNAKLQLQLNPPPAPAGGSKNGNTPRGTSSVPVKSGPQGANQ